ncbi:UDP-N-acetylmuramate--L-alanine ligase [Caldicellulosiruptor naganoensis]|uniref:UDP-N-acetylmuramate--L-alanine ligase n=1 Tax=Caldicellulosiruptor naganoensis TaxID=29324 RepID=A0ABY7BIE7_9FIRM|nr:UDP-N-acetylmuramate--L-alanine ligase [Caldicellulosiruptor naganoensis]WAM31356.1 UDP-N-acetylmuramate--L-alanine ligase [Caldicellulosiruptor naganoensis]
MNKFFLIGIGGISMSAIALILKNQGHIVEGSDMQESKTTKMLRESGINVYIGHDESHIKGDEIVIYTAAISKDNPELVKAKSMGLKVYERAEFLGMLMKAYKNVIAVAGTHGKTTTTSMIGYILKKALLNPTILVGAFVKQLGGNFCIGSNEYLVAEACEYVDSFLKFNPTIGVILNIENDHLDYFKDIDSIKESFRKFALKIPQNGFVVANLDDENVCSALKDLHQNVIYFSAKTPADFWADNITSCNGYYEFDIVSKDSKVLSHIKLNIPGFHNVYNSLAAFTVAYLLGIDTKIIKETICKFGGASRRLEKIGDLDGILLYDDYAHHPTEIQATISTLKKLANGRVIVIFQPHTFSRLKSLMPDFVKSLATADKVIVTDVYAAREKNVYGISSKDLYEKLKEAGIECEYISEFEKIAEFVLKIAQKGDIVATIGAGDINKCIELIFQKSPVKS